MRPIVLILSLCLLAGCDHSPHWQTRSITGLMPTLDFTLTDENGTKVSASNYTGTINLLFFGFTSCHDVCPTTLAQMRVVLNRLPPDVADKIRVLFVSVDPKRDTPAKLRGYTHTFGDQFIGLTGTASQLDALTRRYRTTYGYGTPDANGNYEVSHSNGIYVFDTQGQARLLMRATDTIAAMESDLEQLVKR